MFKPCVVRVLVYIIIKIINVQRIVSILLSLKSERGINKTVKSSSANKYNFIRIPLAFFQNHLQTHCSMLSTFNYRYIFLSANVRGLFHYFFRNFIHVAIITPRTDFAWTDGNDAENQTDSDYVVQIDRSVPSARVLIQFFSTYLLIMQFSNRRSCRNPNVGFFREGVRKGYFVCWGLEGVSRRIIGNLIWNWFVIKIFKGCRPPPPSDLRMTFFSFFMRNILQNMHIYLKRKIDIIKKNLY